MMDMLIAMGFILCMLYLFYERDGRSRTRATASKGRRSSKRRSR